MLLLLDILVFCGMYVLGTIFMLLYSLEFAQWLDSEPGQEFVVRLQTSHSRALRVLGVALDCPSCRCKLFTVCYSLMVICWLPISILKLYVLASTLLGLYMYMLIVALIRYLKGGKSC